MVLFFLKNVTFRKTTEIAMYQYLYRYCPPFFLFAVSQICGIVIFSLSLNIFICIIIFVAWILFFYLYRLHLKPFFYLLPLVFMYGGISYHIRQYQYHTFIKQVTGKLLTLTGTVTDYIITNKKFSPVSLTLKTEKIRYHQTTETEYKNIVVYVQQPISIDIGDTIVVKDVMIKEPKNFDYTQYMIKQNISGSIFVSSKQVFRIDQNSSWINSIYTMRQKFINQARQKLSPDTFYLFSSLFLGNKQEALKAKNLNPDTLAHVFKKWGLSHYLARSGLHLVIFIFLWQALLAYLPCVYWLKQFILLFITFFYALLSWSSISFMRALATLVICKIYYISKKRYHFINTLSLISFIFLLYNPLYLFFLDFQLSFLLTFGLAWHNQISQWRNKN